MPALYIQERFFAQLLSTCCASIICVHNHPSGNLNPSKEDINITKRLVQAGNIIGIDVLNHIIIGHSRYFSLKEQGLLLQDMEVNV
ncbi:JAB domain-containing protein [Brevibacillus laterosporus]|uniref:JAB domain-containing protein n=1 Tax=Brevibacillus laterosporus TaxID=1465 RepID=UPI002E1BB307|nr:JAB domain-containing protein [Brevibacillus laterosporus]